MNFEFSNKQNYKNNSEFRIPNSELNIAPVILAAGDSKRMGYPKALLPLGRELFLTRILRVLRDAGFPRPRLILGRAAAQIEARIREWPVDILINHEPERGQLSSIQIGLDGLSETFDAAMIWPVDQPAVSVELVRGLADLFFRENCRAALPLFGERRGHPAIFHRTLFQEFMDAPLMEGPRSVLLKYRPETCFLPVEEAASVEDIDTPEEYRILTGRSLDAALKDVTRDGNQFCKT